MLARCLWSLYFTFAMFMNSRLLLAVFTVLRSVKDGRYGFEVFWKYQRLGLSLVC